MEFGIKAHDITFNAMVQAMYNRKCPCGYVKSDELCPQTLAEALAAPFGKIYLAARYDDEHTVTVFGDKEIAYQFDAWVRTAYLRGKCEFSPEGSRAAFKILVSDVLGRYSMGKSVAHWISLIEALVIDVPQWHRDHPETLYDERLFVLDNVRVRAEAITEI